MTLNVSWFPLLSVDLACDSSTDVSHRENDTSRCCTFVGSRDVIRKPAPTYRDGHKPRPTQESGVSINMMVWVVNVTHMDIMRKNMA